MANSLPPLPSSDEESLSRNRYDSYYKVRSQEFWGPNEVSREELEPDKKCEHEFKMIPSGVECVRCHFGLIGPLEVREGKLFNQGEPIGL